MVPDEIALKAPFNGKNGSIHVETGTSPRRGNGSCPVAGHSRGGIFAKKSQDAVTGNGNASKEQVASMLKTLMNIKYLPDTLDATDALAVALCHYYNRNRGEGSGSYSGWKGYIKKNPGRVK